MKTIKTILTLAVVIISMASCETEMPTPGDEPSPQFSALTMEEIMVAWPNYSEALLTVIDTTPIIHEGSILTYRTSQGHFGKMEITHYNFANNHKMSFTYVTYAEDGSVYAQNYNAGVNGTFSFDLDVNGDDSAETAQTDFHYVRHDANRTSILPTNESRFYVWEIGTPE